MEGVSEERQNSHVKNVTKKQAYFCSNCDFPSDEIGLLQPCSHVFCLSCASMMSDCAMYVTTQHVLDISLDLYIVRFYVFMECIGADALKQY
jgi:hypothetical protein